jgi:RHS repeat-associated protein
MLKKVLWFLVTVTVSFALICSVSADDYTIFGPKDLKIGWFGMHFSIHRFSAEKPGGGVMLISKNTPDKDIKGGFIRINGKFMPLRHFLRGDGLILEKEIKLYSRNYLLLFLRGERRASIRLEVKRTGLPPANTPPGANPQTVTTDEDTSVSIRLTGSDPDGDKLTYQVNSGPAHGSLSGAAPDLTYTPHGNFHGTDFFTFKVNDGEFDSEEATVTITVAAVNDSPVAEDQLLTTNEDTPSPITLTGSDLDGDTLSYVVVTGPSHGTVTGTAPNLIYTPHPDYHGPDSFEFKVNDGTVDSALASVIIAVEPVNDPPLANDISASTDEDNPVAITLSGSDVDGDTLSYTLVSGPNNGMLAGTPPHYTYTPNDNFHGSDSCSFTVNDGALDSAEAVVTISVNPVNDTPIANDQVVITEEDVAVPITLSGSDVDGDTLAYHIVSGPGSGILSGTPPSFTYTPNKDFSGTDVFDFKINDNILDSAIATVTITVNAVNDAPIAGAGMDQTVFVGDPVTLDGSESSDVDGDSLTYMWSFLSIPQTSNATLPADPLLANPTFVPDVAGVYVARLFVNDGTADSDPDEVEITAEVPPVTVEPQPEGSFGEQYEDLIPPDATAESYDPARFAVVTGMVQNLAGEVIPEVLVSILDHPEYGSVKTDSAGQFSLPLEGGATSTVVYQKIGLISVQRKVYVPWNDIAVAKTIQMIAEDSAATTLTFDGNPDTIVTHQSTEVTDELGTRSVSLVFTGDNQAHEVDDQGNVIRTLTEITTRATEFPTPESMPAILPPTSAFTYCAELKVDGVEHVQFDNPVVVWVENFLGFDVGEVVPVGSYDRARGLWVPEENGLVVDLLDTDADGSVDALDSDGDGQPDDLNTNGSFSDEIRGLNDSQKYQANTTFWRAEISHFSPIDMNWPVIVPDNAIPPNSDGKAAANQQKEEGKDCNNNTGSFVEERSGIFHEDIPIPGTDITLHYASNGVDGYRAVITVPASGETVPDTLKRIAVRVKLAGRVFEQTFEGPPNSLINRKAEFQWDGLDHLGKEVEGSITARVDVGFFYQAVYGSAGQDARAFARAGVAATTVPARQETVIWKSDEIRVQRQKSSASSMAEGWTVSRHHWLSPTSPSTLYKGDGTVLKNMARIIETFAGTGNWGYPTDGEQAIEADLSGVNSLNVDAKGNLYITDYYSNLIYKVDTEGIISTVVGTGGSGYNGDNIPATEAFINGPRGTEMDSEGNLYFADLFNNRIRKVDTSGIITTIAGNGQSGYSGDGGPATQAKLAEPDGIALDASGNLYIADLSTHRIRKVDTNGIITTVAGNGRCTYNVTQGPALQRSICYPGELVVDSAGNLYIANGGNSVIHKVDTEGILTTFAGSGQWGYCGDGGPATEACLDGALGMYVDSSDNVYFADGYNNCIRRVDTKGIITRVAGICGDDEWGYSGDGGPATEARLDWPWDVAGDPSGNLYIADYYNVVVRKVGLSSAFFDILPGGDIPFPDSNGRGYIMSSSGLHKSTIDLDSGVVLYEFEYDDEDNLVSITDRFGNQTLIERDGDGVSTAIISPDGMRTTLSIDSSNHLTGIRYPDDTLFSFEYTPDGLPTAKIEPEGNRFEHTFDSAGRLTDATDQEGGHWQYSRFTDDNGDSVTQVTTGEGNITSYLDHTDPSGAYTSTITSPTGAQTVFSEEPDGLTASKEFACGMALDFEYDLDPEYLFKYAKRLEEHTPLGLARVTLRERDYQDSNGDEIPDVLTETVAVNGKTTILENNVFQSKRTIISPTGKTVSTNYDPDTLLTTTLSIPGLHDTTYGYDVRGRLTSITTNTRQASFTYDGEGNLASSTDPENHTTNYFYDSVGRMIDIDRPDASSVAFTYDKNGNMTMLTNPSDVDHGFGYNKVNLTSSYITPLSGGYSYVYDSERKLTQVNFPSGKQINNYYSNGRLVQIKTPQPEEDVDLTYLCSTKVDTITKGTESISYGYDGSLVTAEVLSGTLNESMSYTYNNDLNLTSFSYTGGTVGYTYDDDGLLTGSGAFAISRNSGNGLPESVTGGALNLSRTFNGYGEVEGQDFTVGSQAATSWSLSRDNAGRIARKTETVNGVASSYDYTYDPMGRLLTVTKDGSPVEEYVYDSVGTRISESNTLRSITNRSYSYSDEDHLLTAGDATYQYDVDGYLTTRTVGTEAPFGVTSYSYSSRGELLSVSLPDGRVVEYLHDPLGRRIAKKVDGPITEKYLWQGLTRLLAVYDGSDNLVMRFLYADGRMPVAMERGGATYYLTYDQVGSLRVVADAAGNMVKRIDYDSFGNITDDTNAAFEIPFGFAGGLQDRDTGLVRFGFRDYDPDVGRWTAKDPILFAGGETDLYGYALNNPISLIDPRGLWTVGVGLGGTAGAGAAVSGSVLVVFDGHGNIGFAESAGGGGMGGINASGGLMFQVTTADTIYNLKGFSTQTGGSFGEPISIGGEYIIGNGYTGVNINVGIGGGLTPGELHSVLEYAAVQGVNIFDIARHIRDLIKARQAASPCS